MKSEMSYYLSSFNFRNFNFFDCCSQRMSLQTVSPRFFAKGPILVDTSSNSIQLDVSKCIGCGACVRACKTVAGQSVLKLVQHNGKKIVQTTTGKAIEETKCIGCGQCTLACPVGALVEKDATKELKRVLSNKQGKVCVCQIAPAVRINMAEALGVPAGSITTGKLVTALKKLGFDYVFDTNYGADLTIVEEATELLHRLNDPNAVLPMCTSCCPAWVNYVEKSAHDVIPHLSSCRSPMGMLSALTKNVFPEKIGKNAADIFNVAIMPCTGKKDEAKRAQLRTKDGLQETDVVIGSRELAKMIKAAGIKYKELPDTPCDNFYSEATGGGAIFCATGGVMEAAVRSAYKFVTGEDLKPIEFTAVRGTKSGIKVGDVSIKDVHFKVAVAHGIKNAMQMLQKIKGGDPEFKDVKFFEVMACPGGCVAGGGSPKAKTKKVLEKRLEATYKLDVESKHHTSQDNEQLQQLYKESFDGQFGSHRAHELLHTHYNARK